VNASQNYGVKAHSSWACVSTASRIYFRPMATLVAIVDFMVLLMYLASIPRVVSRWHSRGIGALVLPILIAMAIAIFGMVSFIANAGLVAASSSLTQAIILLFLLLMAALVRASLAKKPTAN
jgi:hypothetical protein